jgi:hypothetical protein
VEWGAEHSKVAVLKWYSVVLLLECREGDCAEAVCCQRQVGCVGDGQMSAVERW